MDAPPTLPPLPPSNLFLSVTSSFPRSVHTTDMNDNGRGSTLPNGVVNPTHDSITHPPAAPTPPPFVQQVTRESQGAQTPSGDPPPPVARSRSNSVRSRAQSRSTTHSSERSASNDEDSEEEEREHSRYRWQPLDEDKSEPCQDEMEYIHSRPEHSALDHGYWESLAFFDLKDPDIEPISSGRIDWLVERFNGTKDEPNNELIMRSPVVSIGGYDWRIKFYPHGDDTHFLSVYIENVTMQSAGFAEFESFQLPPFPALDEAESQLLRKRRSVAAQVAIVMYNPAEPRTYREEVDAHQYNKSKADYGWKFFTPRHDFHYRQHGERQAILRGDKLAFSAYIRIVDDPTGCMWQHESENSYDNSIMTTGLRPFACQLPHIAAIVPLLHFAPLREYLINRRAASRMVHSLQVFLYHKLYRRQCSPHYHEPADGEPADAIAYMRQAARLLAKECDANTIAELLGTFDSENGAAIGGNRLKTATCGSVQAAIDQHPTPLATPALLSLELQRHEFNKNDRKWVKLTNRVEMNTKIVVSGVAYYLFAFVTHCGDLQSNKHNCFVNPGGPDEIWFKYSHRRVTAMTTQQALREHCGFNDVERKKRNMRHSSPFGGVKDTSDDEVAYAVLYVREDITPYAFVRPMSEVWDDIPQRVKEGKAFPEQRAVNPGAEREDESDLPLRAEQDRHERERQRILDHMAAGSSTPDWSLSDGEDAIMSDADNDEDYYQAAGMAASTSLARNTEPSSNHIYTNTIDTLGRDYYKGQMLGSEYHGEGHLITLAGNEYVGAFRNGKQNGYGKMIYAATGNIYEGEWKDGQHHGQGKLTEASTGNVFEGGWQEGKKHGEFILRGKVTEEDKGCCTICYVNAMTTAFYDCGHVVACRECAAKVDNCPICRKRVLARLELFGVKMILE